MIVAERKPFEEIKSLLEDYQRVLVVGCATCVAVCLTGGEKEATILANQLDLAYRLAGEDRKFDVECCQRQCDMEFMEHLDPVVDDYDALLSLACGAGIQFLSDRYPRKVVLPAVNTTFVGANVDVGVWEEKCRLCGQCVLGQTGGICPMTRCAKRVQNGPCGGTRADGSCEVNPDQPCAWYLIYQRLSEQGRLHLLEEMTPVRDYRVAQYPAKQIHPAYERRYSAQE
ncbi:MAG: methylenetetrahydrofolate reductase C-terminal domain-containing protein [Deltaproteobacteria bacterium]|nr:methylenetetrahydrofolate reductase C-terminal domain-containing protein [Deltaproteobacteria bacterium]